ncbi:MAG TPA: aminopeptidase [Longimicrobiales bacterium]|nr:aminopeptidase [Longimicrobiales bacterium]
MGKKKLLLLAVLAATAAASLTCSPVYVVRAGIEEARILSRRRPIPEVASDPSIPQSTRAKLDLVLRARTFAGEYLGLDTGDSYTTFSQVDRDTLLMVVSGAHKDRFQHVTWWFPIVGRVPYKGFFDFDAARREVERLESDGYDAYMRPSAAFSTLGWFNDPLLSTLLRANEISLVGTVIHEITHNTLYLPSQAAFNESFANFVGERGAIAFFCGMDGEEAPRCETARAGWADQLRFGAFLSELVAELEALYGRPDLPREEILRRREDVFAGARARFRAEVEPELRVLAFGRFMEQDLNNATLISRRLYYDRLDVFEAAFHAHGGDLRRTVDFLLAAARDARQDPYGALAELLAEVAPPLPVHPTPEPEPPPR